MLLFCLIQPECVVTEAPRLQNTGPLLASSIMSDDNTITSRSYHPVCDRTLSILTLLIFTYSIN